MCSCVSPKAIIGCDYFLLGSYHPLVLASRLAVGREAVEGFSLGGDFKAEEWNKVERRSE